MQVYFTAKDSREMFPVRKKWWEENWWLEFEADMTRAGTYTFEVRTSWLMHSLCEVMG